MDCLVPRKRESLRAPTGRETGRPVRKEIELIDRPVDLRAAMSRSQIFRFGRQRRRRAKRATTAIRGTLRRTGEECFCVMLHMSPRSQTFVLQAGSWLAFITVNLKERLPSGRVCATSGAAKHLDAQTALEVHEVQTAILKEFASK